MKTNVVLIHLVKINTGVLTYLLLYRIPDYNFDHIRVFSTIGVSDSILREYSGANYKKKKSHLRKYFSDSNNLNITKVILHLLQPPTFNYITIGYHNNLN